MFEKSQEKIMRAYLENPDRFSICPIRLFLSKDNYEKLMRAVEKNVEEKLSMRSMLLGFNHFIMSIS